MQNGDDNVFQHKVSDEEFQPALMVHFHVASSKPEHTDETSEAYRGVI